jgi:hypothetical protein
MDNIAISAATKPMEEGRDFSRFILSSRRHRLSHLTSLYGHRFCFGKQELRRTAFRKQTRS